MRARQGHARWSSSSVTHRRCTLILGGVLLIWLMVIIRYYYQFWSHEHYRSLVDPHPPHHEPPNPLLPTRLPPPPPEESSASSSSSSSSASSSSSDTSSSLLSSSKDDSGDHSSSAHVIIPDGQRHHRMSSPAIVIIGHDRDDKIRALYASLISQPHVEQFRIYISCDLPSMQHKITSALPHDANVTYWWHTPMVALPGKLQAWQQSGLFRISYHFKMALTRVFDDEHHSHAIFIEEDLILSPDFLQLFIDTSWLLDNDATLYCISAWNDNGFQSLTHDHTRLFRTGYFPGLGWMIKRDMWTDHLRGSWPAAATTGWDHWLRLSSISQYRECISPEIPRTQHTSESGINVNSASAALFAKYAFSKQSPILDGSGFGDTSRLLAGPYDTQMKELVASAIRIKSIHDISIIMTYTSSGSGVYVLPYNDEQYQMLATTLGLWPDHGARGWYHGIISTRLAGRSDIIILLAERRRAALYLRDDEARHQMDGTILVAAKGGENCHAACTRSSGAANMRRPSPAGGNGGRALKCFDTEIAFVNTCEALSKVFDCEAGCGHQIGGELPAYVIDDNERTYRQCLVTDGANTCTSAHPATQRVCPCNPSS